MDATVPSLRIRDEESADQERIGQITEIAFRDMPYAGGDEQDVIERLRKAGALTLSLVAVLDQDTVGHIAFSPARQSDGSHPWFALGPVSVLPDHQGKGIGSALIERGLASVRELGALGVILTGNPAYYQRFGFQPAPQYAPGNEPSEFFMLKQFTAANPNGAFQFHEGFYSGS